MTLNQARRYFQYIYITKLSLQENLDVKMAVHYEWARFPPTKVSDMTCDIVAATYIVSPLHNLELYE
jgi:hypothetical protein